MMQSEFAMPKIQPFSDKQQVLCAEIPGQPCGMVVFGASGDLTQRKLLVSLFELWQRGLVSEKFYVIGCGRKNVSDEKFRSAAKQSVESRIAGSNVSDEFLQRLYFVSGNYDDETFYEDIKCKLAELDDKYGVPGCHIFYLAIPPSLYETVSEHLGKSGLSGNENSRCRNTPRLIIEKPFGRDLQSAVSLNDRITKHFTESQIYRIDHYLGKETVQNILMFRFANSIFEPVWNRNYIDHVQITIAESLGVESRAGYYDSAGAMRDMFQNHMLGMLSLVAMEAPVSFEAGPIRDEKVKLLRSVRPLESAVQNGDVVRAQYTAGQNMPGYRQEKAVADDSQTETYVAAKIFIDNMRWKDVPFYLRTGKRLARRVTEIAITFKQVPHSMFASVGLDELPANVLVLKIQPDEGINLGFQAKRPGSKVCMSTLKMDFNYAEVFGTSEPQAYQRLLLDSMVGDQTLFTRQDDVEVSWGLMMPILDAWQKGDGQLYEYPAGDESFLQADALIESDDRKWRRLSEM